MSALGKVTWKVMAVGSGLAAGTLSRSVAESVWRKVKKVDPPRNPASPSTTWGEALSWAVATGVATGVFRLLATRAAAGAYRKAAGHLPRGLEEVGA